MQDPHIVFHCDLDSWHVLRGLRQVLLARHCRVSYCCWHVWDNASRVIASNTVLSLSGRISFARLPS